MPPDGQNVLVTLADGSESLAYWHDGAWWVGVDGVANDIVLEQVVEFWRWSD
jgi:hypothetical protein